MEGQGFSSVFDCKWSPDGLSIAATDAYGHIIILGHGNQKPFDEIQYEQFFHTDYRPLLWDESGLVKDEQTGIEPHLMVPPFLVNADGAPYPPNIQKFVPGRENLSSSLQVAVTNRIEEGMQVSLLYGANNSTQGKVHMFFQGRCELYLACQLWTA